VCSGFTFCLSSSFQFCNFYGVCVFIVCVCVCVCVCVSFVFVFSVSFVLFQFVCLLVCLLSKNEEGGTGWVGGSKDVGGL
jgi:ABC-type sugar transport system permease subunit